MVRGCTDEWAGALARARQGAYNGGMTRIGAALAAVLLVVLAVGASALAAPSAHKDEHAIQADASPLSGQPVESESESEAPEASEAPKADEPQAESAEADGAPSQQVLDRIVANLSDAGIETDAATVADLAATYGVGGAVRLIAWADASGQSVDDLAAMFDGGTGWGRIAQQLNADDDALHLSPGIGWLMGNGHHKGDGPGNGVGKALGRATAPGQQNK